MTLETTIRNDPAPSPSAQTVEWHEGDMPYSRTFGDHFYSRADGRLECGHVFLAGNDLPRRWQHEGVFTIGELGFGTGLNFCETWRQWLASAPTGASLRFVSFERFPMDGRDLQRALAHWPDLSGQSARLIARWPSEPTGTIDIDFGDGVELTVVCGEALEEVAKIPAGVDAWYLDGFAPSRNPGMWSPDLMRHVFDKTVVGGSFATYAAAGFVRRNLQAVGFKVERRQGFAGKREMLCGVKPASDVA